MVLGSNCIRYGYDHLKMKNIIFILLLLMSSKASAGYGTGTITSLFAHAQGGNGAGTIMFTITVHEQAPSCSTVGDPSEWAFSLNTEHGKAMYSMLLSAQAQNKEVTVSGWGNGEAGNCDDWGDRERPKYIRIRN